MTFSLCNRRNECCRAFDVKTKIRPFPVLMESYEKPAISKDFIARCANGVDGCITFFDG
jgi:hypothetical protein